MPEEMRVDAASCPLFCVEYRVYLPLKMRVYAARKEDKKYKLL